MAGVQRGAELDALDETDMTPNLTPRTCLGLCTPPGAYTKALGRRTSRWNPPPPGLL